LEEDKKRKAMPLFQKKKTTRSVIKCPECERTFYSDEYNRENVADSCHCGNIDIGIIETLEDSAYEHLMGTWYKRTPPEIYDEPLPPAPEPEVIEIPRKVGFHQNNEKNTKLSDTS
jgi:hypothetical protein